MVVVCIYSQHVKGVVVVNVYEHSIVVVIVELCISHACLGIMLNTKNLHFHLIVRDIIIAHSHHFSISAVGPCNIIGLTVIGSCGMSAAIRSRADHLGLFIGCRLSAPVEM